MGRRRQAVYVYGMGEPVKVDCPGKKNTPRNKKANKSTRKQSELWTASNAAGTRNRGSKNLRRRV